MIPPSLVTTIKDYWHRYSGLKTSCTESFGGCNYHHLPDVSNVIG